MRLFTILLCFISYLALGQKQDDAPKIYQKSLEIFISYIDTAYILSNKTLYFDALPGISYYLPKSINNYKIIFLTVSEKEKLLEQEQKTIVIYTLFPLQEAQGNFFIPISTYNLTKSESSVTAVWHIVFTYDCSNNEFIFNNIKGGGF